MAQQTFVSRITVNEDVGQTIVKKIVVGTPLRRVTGTSAQELCDLIDVVCTGKEDGDIVEFDIVTEKFYIRRDPRLLVIRGGTF